MYAAFVYNLDKAICIHDAVCGRGRDLEWIVLGMPRKNGTVCTARAPSACHSLAETADNNYTNVWPIHHQKTNISPIATPDLFSISTSGREVVWTPAAQMHTSIANERKRHLVCPRQIAFAPVMTMPHEMLLIQRRTTDLRQIQPASSPAA